MPRSSCTSTYAGLGRDAELRVLRDAHQRLGGVGGRHRLVEKHGDLGTVVMEPADIPGPAQMLLFTPVRTPLRLPPCGFPARRDHHSCA